MYECKYYCYCCCYCYWKIQKVKYEGVFMWECEPNWTKLKCEKAIQLQIVEDTGEVRRDTKDKSCVIVSQHKPFDLHACSYVGIPVCKGEVVLWHHHTGVIILSFTMACCGDLLWKITKSQGYHISFMSIYLQFSSSWNPFWNNFVFVKWISKNP